MNKKEKGQFNFVAISKNCFPGRDRTRLALKRVSLIAYMQGL
jgi:hypothetical protein